MYQWLYYSLVLPFRRVNFHSRSDYDVTGVCDALYYALSSTLLRSPYGVFLYDANLRIREPIRFYGISAIVPISRNHQITFPLVRDLTNQILPVLPFTIHFLPYHSR